MKTWRDKAHREIARMSMAAFLQANTKPNGTRYKRRRPYHVPELARELVKCLDTNDELRAKQIFVYELH